MIKRTLYFGNPAYLSLRNGQMVLHMPDSQKEEHNGRTFPIEDLAYIVLDHKQITITQALLEALLQAKCAVITCDSSHMPSGMMLPLDGNTLQSERWNSQIKASLPLRKQLWRQTVQSKILNQAVVLKKYRNVSVDNLYVFAEKVKSGDSTNLEARAAVYYWKNLFNDYDEFTRDRYGIFPNNLLNYGYAILRSVIARALVCKGLLPTLGIHHCNRYNAYCLADDIMEPYRPFVDEIVIGITEKTPGEECLSREVKKILLSIPTKEVRISGKRSPLMIAAETTAYSLFRCYEGEIKKIIYPNL